MSTLIDRLPPLPDVCERRFYARIEPCSQTQLSFGSKSLATLLNLSENGLLVCTPNALDVNSVHQVELALKGVAVPIHLTVLTVWSDPTWQKSGLQFLDLRDSDRDLLRAWAARQTALIEIATPRHPEILEQVESTEVSPSGTVTNVETSTLSPTVVPALPPSAESKRSVPMRYFWVSFAATIFVGAAWATIHDALPEKSVGARAGTVRSISAASKPATVPASALNTDGSKASDTASSSAQNLAPPNSQSSTLARPLDVRTSSPIKRLVVAPTSPPNVQPIATTPAASASKNADDVASRPEPVPAQPAPTAAPPTVVVSTPAYSNQFLDVPPRAVSAYVLLPGESVVRTPTLAMHIQRSVWVPTDHGILQNHRKVELGELATRVNPQLPRSSPGYGSITVLASIGRNGQLLSVRPLYGSASLLPSVSYALRGWRYRPTYLDGRPVETLARIEVDFHSPERALSR